MRTFRKTIRFLARLVYCGLWFLVCLGLLMALFGIQPLGVFAHGNVPLPSRNYLLLIFNGTVMIIVCDLYFRITRKYRDDEERVGE